METLLEIDTQMFLWLNHWVGKWTLGDYLVALLVSDYFVPVVLSLFLLGMWFCGRTPDEMELRQRSVIRALVTIGFVGLLVYVLNEYYFRPRPFTEHDIVLLFYQPTDSSFPANPAAISFAIAHSVWQGSKAIGKGAYFLAAIWSISRVYAGVFYPLDVIAGALIGIIVSIVVGLALRKIEPVPTMVLRLARVFHLA